MSVLENNMEFAPHLLDSDKKCGFDSTSSSQ